MLSGIGAADQGKPRRAAHGPRRLLAQLAPVLLLGVAYPLAGPRLAEASVGAVPLTRILIAMSLTVPWLSQAVCMPLFATLSPDLGGGDVAGLGRRILVLWPRMLLTSAVCVAVFAVPVWLAEGWGLRPLLAYAALCMLNAVFAQSLVYSIAGKRPLYWSLGWAAYALALLAAPALWFFPPLAAIGVQLVPILRDRGTLTRRAAPRVREILTGHLTGALTGGVLWGSIYVYLLRFPNQVDPLLIWAALLSAIVVYNYFFTLFAPNLDSLMTSLRTVMEDQPIPALRASVGSVAGYVGSSTIVTGLVAALLGSLAFVGFALVDPAGILRAGAEILASWSFLMASIACYELAYIGVTKVAYGFGFLHLCLLVLVFSLSPIPWAAYVVLGTVELPLTILLIRRCLDAWGAPQFFLFWRHATRW